jgi:hypothetical protein
VDVRALVFVLPPNIALQREVYGKDIAMKQNVKSTCLAKYPLFSVECAGINVPELEYLIPDSLLIVVEEIWNAFFF